MTPQSTERRVRLIDGQGQSGLTKVSKMTLATRRKERERGDEETVYCNYQLLGERHDIGQGRDRRCLHRNNTIDNCAWNPQSSPSTLWTDSLRHLITVLYQLVTCSVTLNTVCSATTSPSATALVINSGFNYTCGAIRYPRRSDTDWFQNLVKSERESLSCKDLISSMFL